MTNLNRRTWFQTMAAAGVGIGSMRCSWAQPIADQLISAPISRRLIVLWMAGGPSQMDTFDLKVGHANGGEFKEIETSVPGVRISEHLPRLASLTHHMAIVRSLQTKEGDHGRGTYLVRTGQRPGQPVRYPSLPAVLAKELSPNDPMVPDYVSILPASFINPMAFGSGFLGPKHQPLTVGGWAAPNPQPGVAADPETPVDLRVDNLLPSSLVTEERVARRREFWEMLQQSYGAASRPGAPRAHDTMYRKAMKLSDSELNEAFDLTKEPTEIRSKYGNGAFGQGCLMARRLVERGVPVVEVSLGAGGLGWDTHLDNFKNVKTLSAQLDAGWSQLMMDLDDGGLLSTTTILWIGEFGRTPQINPQAGRDHFPNAWSCVLAGGNVAGGQAFGKTSDDGMEVADAPVTIQEVLATVSRSVGIDPATENTSELGRPIKIAEAEPIKSLLS